MNTSLDNLTHKMQRAALGKIVDVALSRAEQDREKTMCQLVDAAKQFYGSGFSDETYENAKKVLTDPNSKWTKLINCVLDQTDPHVARTTALNLGYEAFFRGTKMIRENRVKYQCNIPWLILFDPTSACNMHCVGCWAGEYGHKNNLSFEDMDKIVTQGKELGVYLYMLTGGEPLVRKKDVLKLAEKHNDVEFAIYTNSTLIDEPFCEEVQRLGNIAFMLSIEGTPETNDARRGEGHYAAVMHAMDLLKKYGILFGTSICYTLRLLLPLYARGQRGRPGADAHPGAAQVHDRPYPLSALFCVRYPVLPYGLPERRRVRGRLHRRRPQLLPHQLCR